MKLRDKCQKHQEHYVKYVAKHDIHACQTNKAPLFSPDSVCCATCLGWPTFKHFQTIPNQHFSKALIRCIVWALLVGMDCQMLSLSLSLSLSSLDPCFNMQYYCKNLCVCAHSCAVYISTASARLWKRAFALPSALSSNAVSTPPQARPFPWLRLDKEITKITQTHSKSTLPIHCPIHSKSTLPNSFKIYIA